jgi:hypothetical protein
MARAEEEASMRVFCERVGELVLWGAAIDGQLTEAIVRACSLKRSPMLGPIIGELGTRAKCDILRARAKHITNLDWRRGIMSWLATAGQANTYRNTVAHHEVKTVDGKLTLFSGAARKLLASIEDGKPKPPKSVTDINQWIETAKRAYEQGQTVLANLERLAKAEQS